MAREVFVLEEKEGDELVPRETSDRDGAARLQESANASAMIGVDCRVVRYVPEDELEHAHRECSQQEGLADHYQRDLNIANKECATLTEALFNAHAEIAQLREQNAKLQQDLTYTWTLINPTPAVKR